MGLTRLLMVLIVGAVGVWGNVCGPAPREHVCATLTPRPVAFRVKVVAIHSEQALARVEEVFWGRKERTRYVVLGNPWYAVGGDYIISWNPVGFARWRGVPLPQTVGDPTILPSYSDVGMCGGTPIIASVDWTSDELDFLRHYARQGRAVANSIRGTVHHQKTMSAGEPAAGVRVEIRSGKQVWRRTTDAHGRYVVDGLQAGDYEVRVEPGNLKLVWEGRQQVRLDRNRCGTPWAILSSETFVRGRVVDPDRRAVEVWPTLAAVNADGSVRAVDVAAGTQKDGRFEIGPVPAGRYVVGVNLDDRQVSSSPWARSVSKPFEVKVGQDVDGVNLQLEKPVPFGWLYVDLFWADGSPVEDSARAQAVPLAASTPGWNEHNAAPSGSNRVRLHLPLRRRYRIEGHWEGVVRKEYQWSRYANWDEVEFTRDGQVVRVQLEENHP